MAMFGKGVTDSAGILEVLGKSGTADSTASVFTLIPTDETVPPEPRTAQNVDGALSAVDEYLKARNADAVFRPLVLIPAGCGEGSAVGSDAVVLLADSNAARRELPRNPRASLIVGACGLPPIRVRGDCFVVRFFHDTADPLRVRLGGEATPALLAERCWLERAQSANKSDAPSAAPAAGAPALPVAARRDVLEKLLVARLAEAARRGASASASKGADAAPAGPSEVAGTGGAMAWEDARDQVRISAQLPEGTKPGHVRIEITDSTLSVRVGAMSPEGQFKLATLLDGELFQAVRASECTWTLTDSGLGSMELRITLTKAHSMRWLMILRSG